MDGIPTSAVRRNEQYFRIALSKLPVRVTSTMSAAERSVLNEDLDLATKANRIVEHDLHLLRRADLVLLDLSKPGHTYVGCICEMVYAHLMKIPIVAYVGDTDNGSRIWLVYHCKAICKTTAELKLEVAQLLHLM